MKSKSLILSYNFALLKLQYIYSVLTSSTTTTTKKGKANRLTENIHVKRSFTQTKKCSVNNNT